MKYAYAVDKNGNKISIMTTTFQVFNQEGENLDSILENMNQDFDDLKQHVSDGKTAIASAITDMNQATASNATFATMAENIRKISTDADAVEANVYPGKKFYSAGRLRTGTMATKAAASYTPNDSQQVINGGQYLDGAQTINAVPTQTKAVTAGTSNVTVNRDTGKYMTSVTVYPTPSQEKSVTLTEDTATVTPDSGYLLSKVTINAEGVGRWA